RRRRDRRQRKEVAGQIFTYQPSGYGWKPICFRGGSGVAINSLIASKTVANFSSYLFSSASILRARSRFVSIKRRSCTKVRIIAIFTSTARAPEDAGEHCHALFGKRVGWAASASVQT